MRWSWAGLSTTARWGGWGLLLLLVAVPIPIPLAQIHPLQSDQTNTLWIAFLLILAGVLASLGSIARVSRPLAWLLAWVVVRTILGGMPLVSLWHLMLMLSAAWLLVAVARLPEGSDGWLCLVILVESGINGAVGMANLFGFYPSLRLWTPGFDGHWYLSQLVWAVDPRLAHLPQGFLTHPNYWGMAMALALPLVVWATRGWPSWVTWNIAGLWTLLAAVSWSRGTWVALAAVWIVLLPSWQWRAAPIGLLAGGALYGLMGHWWVSGWGGRWPVWALGGHEVWVSHPWAGEGLGMWSHFALDPASPIHHLEGPWSGWFTAAFNEPLQLWFELGLIGVALGVWLAVDLIRAALRGRHDPVLFTWSLVLLVVGVEMWVSIPFRLGPIVLPAVIAAGRLSGRQS